jgi:hypothetical protein
MFQTNVADRNEVFMLRSSYVPVTVLSFKKNRQVHFEICAKLSVNLDR